MKRICKRLLLLLATLGAGALAYALMRAEGEWVLRKSAAALPGGRGPSPSRGKRKAGPAAAAGSGRCAAVTGSGKPCGRESQPGSAYCWQHA